VIPSSGKTHPAQQAKGTTPSGAVPDRPSVFDIFLDPKIMADPYPLYERVLAEYPVQGEGGLPLVLTRYADVSAALANPLLSTDDRHDVVQKSMAASGEMPPHLVAMMDRRSFLHRDPPQHTRLRALAGRALTAPRLARAIEAGQQACDRLLDDAAGRGSMDLIADLAYPLPAAVLGPLLGIPVDTGREVPWWRSQMSADFEAPAVAGVDCATYSNTVQDQMVARFDDLIAAKREHPGDDVVSDLLAAAGAGELSAADVNDTCRLLVVAAHETMTGLIGNGMLALLRNPAQLALLRDAPALAGGAVEEVLRYDAPIQFVRRVAVADLTVNGIPVNGERMVFGWIGSANRDPARFAEPGTFDITRDDHGHLGFGGGAHACLGAALARPLAGLVLATLCRRLIEPELAADPPPYLPNAVRAIESLPVSFRAIGSRRAI
jgi:cytochrome P450